MASTPPWAGSTSVRLGERANGRGGAASHGSPRGLPLVRSRLLLIGSALGTARRASWRRRRRRFLWLPAAPPSRACRRRPRPLLQTPPPAMPMPSPSSSAKAKAKAERLANHWIVGAIACNKSIAFSTLAELLCALPEYLEDAPKATRERVALRCLQDLSSLIAAPGDAAPKAKVPRVDGALSCEDLVCQLSTEAKTSGEWDKDLLRPFGPVIWETIRTAERTLPENPLKLLREFDPCIKSELERNGSKHHDNDSVPAHQPRMYFRDDGTLGKYGGSAGCSGKDGGCAECSGKDGEDVLGAPEVETRPLKMAKGT